MHLWQKVNNDIGKELCEKYESKNVLLADLSKEYEVSSYIISKVLEHNNIKLKSRSEIAKETNSRSHLKQRRYSLNFDYFKKWGSDMSYYLGFIYADGCLKGTLLRIALRIGDKEFLEEFREAIGFGGSVKEGKVTVKGKQYGYASIDIKSLDMSSDLREKGVYENKSMTLTLPDIPKEYELDFIRGYFDGDGSVSVKRQVHKYKNSDTYQVIVTFTSGSYEMLHGVQRMLSNNGLKSKTPKSYGGRNYYEIAYSTSESYKIYDLFYKDKDSRALERKKDVFEKGFALRG